VQGQAGILGVLGDVCGHLTDSLLDLSEALDGVIRVRHRARGCGLGCRRSAGARLALRSLCLESVNLRGQLADHLQALIKLLLEHGDAVGIVSGGVRDQRVTKTRHEQRADPASASIHASVSFATH
jgi:hypothetical protein